MTRPLRTTPTRRPSCLGLRALTLISTACLLMPAAKATGHLTQVQVLDRDSGEMLQVHTHRGEHWVAGHPGARYAIVVRNASIGRLLNVISVDGVNVVSGETAAWDQTGYVIHPSQAHEIKGWRKSNHEVAAFHFSVSEDAYASRTGRPDDLGVIGVAVFREKVARSEPQILRQAPARPARGAGPMAESPVPTPAPSSDSQANAASSESRERLAASPAPRLGTGHGDREASYVGHTRFERRNTQPDEIIRIRYDSHANLVAMGVIRPSRTMPPPRPFPGSPSGGYVPDPF